MSSQQIGTYIIKIFLFIIDVKSLTSLYIEMF